MSEAGLSGPRRPGAWWALTIGAAFSFGVFVALGVWQLQRLSWKEALIARVEQGLNVAPVDAPGPAAWAGVDRDSAEYRRVRVRGRFADDRETLVAASTELGSGYWVLTPLQTDDGWWLLVNRGFVPPAGRDPRQRGAGAAGSAGEGEVEGLLRLTEPGGSLLQANDLTAGRWYSRDVTAIAAARGLPTGVAPYFIDAMAPAASARPAPADAVDVWPRPGLTVVHFSNNHRVYALTWFAMAAGAAGAFGYLLREARRLRHAAGAPAHAPRRD